MGSDISYLTEAVQEFMEVLGNFWGTQEARSARILHKAGQKGLFGAFHAGIQEEVSEMDADTERFPYALTKRLLEGRAYGIKEIQTLVDRTSDFTHHPPNRFTYYGKFLSFMIASVLQNEESITLDTHNNTKVYVPDFHRHPNGNESPYPWGNHEKLQQYERDNLLISYLGSNLEKGKLIVRGNVGGFFANGNNGADIKLEGECGWRACQGMRSGKVTINGATGHELAEGARGGVIAVNGQIRSIGAYYTDAYAHNIVHNGMLVPKKRVGGPYNPDMN